jgi:hypothetical protein
VHSLSFVPQTQLRTGDWVIVPLGNDPSFVLQNELRTDYRVVVPLRNDSSFEPQTQ